MSETPLTTSEANALSGATDAEADFTYPAIGESPYYTTMFRCLAKLLRLAKVPGNALRAYKDGELTFAVRAGSFLDGAALRQYAGATAQPLTNNAVNYIYLTSAGTLTVNTDGFPSTPHVPLATIEPVDGSYGHDDVIDCRDRALLSPAGGLTLSAGDESADTRTVSIQCGPGRRRVRVWISDSDYGAPSAAGNTVAVVTGTTLREITAHADYEIISDADGTVAIDITIAGAATRYVLAEADGRIYSSGELSWQA